MAQYSIKELEELSGIKAHTIRIWEKRYGIVAPKRTSTNIRLYSDEDLKKIIKVSLLNNHGVKISKIAKLNSTELSHKVSELSESQPHPDLHIDRLVVAMVDLDEEQFDAIVNELIHRFGFEKTILEIVYPFLEKIGVLWLTGHITPVQEHFITNLLRQKILVAIDTLPPAGKAAPRIILFLPDEELHELGLLFSYYLVKKAGFRAYYMGQRTPYKDVVWFCQNLRPAAMITSITTSPAPNLVEAYLQKLCKDHPGIPVLAAGQNLTKIALRIPQNLQILENPQQLKGRLESLKAV
ncbi:MAG: MerR family transcriptional regulator [Cyclobacteriaceae bacterium]|nr:MerR family transcriptional regulator [Cyclobacteriaceae bacterium]